MRARQPERQLAPRCRHPTHRGQQQRSTRDRLPPPLRLGTRHEQAPPVVHQRHVPRGDPAALQVSGHETAPTPLVLQLVVRVLDVRPLPVKVTQAEHLILEVGHQHLVLQALLVRELAQVQAGLACQQGRA